MKRPLEDAPPPSLTDRNIYKAVRDWFEGKEENNNRIENWDVSRVTIMCGLFAGRDTFNEDISNWDVSAVTDMSGMFAEANEFNQPIGNWIVSSVTDMSHMFKAATAFNQPLAGWDVSQVTNMNVMFKAATAFNQPLAGWNVSSVKNMRSMFHLATAFNQPLSNWDVRKVENMSHMFESATSFHQSLVDWNFSNETDTEKMLGDSTFDFLRSLRNRRKEKMDDAFFEKWDSIQPFSTSAAENPVAVFLNCDGVKQFANWKSDLDHSGHRMSGAKLNGCGLMSMTFLRQLKAKESNDLLKMGNMTSLEQTAAILNKNAGGGDYFQVETFSVDNRQMNTFLLKNMPDNSCTLIRFDDFHTLVVSKEQDGRLFVIDPFTAKNPFQIDILENYRLWLKDRRNISYLVGRAAGQRTTGGGGRRWVAIVLKKSLLRTLRRRAKTNKRLT